MKMIKENLIFIPVAGGAMFRVPQIFAARMRRILLTIGLGLALSGITTFSSRAADAGLMTLTSHVPAVVVSGLKAKRLLLATTNLDLAIGLPLRNQGELTNLLQQIYDPASPNYHHYLTPEEFTAQFGPTEQDYQAVIAFAEASGFTVTGTHSNRVLVDVNGAVTDIQKAFHVTMRVYQHPTEAREFFAPDTEPSLNSTVPILHISGLNNYVIPRPAFHKISFGSQSSAGNPAAGSGPGGTYMGYDFRAAYAPGLALTGAGQTVALFELDGYHPGDIATYKSQTGLPNVPLQNVFVDGYSGVAGANNIEVALDIDMAIAMAPGLSQIVVYEGLNNGNGAIITDMLNRIATDNSAKQISSSWLLPDETTWDQIYLEYAVQGQSFFQASGDNDAFNWNLTDQQQTDDPYITLVGGTTLSTSGPGGAWTTEKVWNWGTGGANGWAEGSGGGISPNYQIPTWQQGINMSANHGSTTARNIPDVALTADNIYVIADNGQQEDVGGTSAAAPLWAGFTALINQQATNNGLTSVGFINPALYAIAKGTNYNTCFHDIATGNNTSSNSPTLFNAVPGYDLCTGWGTPKTNLINALAGIGTTNPITITHISAPLPPYGSALAALNGGNPNGTWELFVLDDALLDSGVISNGWILNLTMASPVGESANLKLSMTVSATNVLAGGILVYTNTVVNYGPSTASNVVISDTLPLGFTVISTNSTMGSVNEDGLICTIDTLTNGGGAQFTLTVQPGTNFVGTIRNYASANSDTPDPNPDDNNAFVDFVVTAVQPPEFGSLVSSNGIFRFTISDSNNPPASTIIIQAATNLAPPISWLDIYTGTATNASFTFTNLDSTNYPCRFYRAILWP
jgi:uncharacterized repeat protein (TIGR01451 family)